ncbi:MAG: arginine--tRNA ligase [Eubacteriales bacterium]|nr:arginine--tRNA ligase [Eubacteriales bacterium]
MELITKILTNICDDAFTKAGYEAGFGRVNVSNRPDICEYQCNGAMALAKKVGKKPIDIANEVAALLKERSEFSKAEAVMPGFINIDLGNGFVTSYLDEMAKDENLSIVQDEKKRVIVDYGGANVAKPLHIGHLRSAVIGEAIKRIALAHGQDAIGDVHLGDWGLQMGLIIEELKDRNQTEFTLSDLEEIYPAASKKSKETDEDGNPTAEAAQFKARALEATKKLQSGDEECTRIWIRIMELSKADLRKNYEHLSVNFELWKGESDVQKYIPEMIDSFIEKGIAREDQGALVVDIKEESDKKEIPPCIVRKSDGASLYATTDLATLVERELLFKPDNYIYVADKRQELHYMSFFRVARKAGIVKEDQGLTFLGFGTMNGKDGKPFKTRSGGVMRLEELIDDIETAVYTKIRASRDESEISEEEAREISQTVGLAALKYGDLSNQAAKDYIFDIDRFTSFEGNTGPYILYTIVRINSILRAYGKDSTEGIEKAIVSSADAKNLGLSLLRFNEASLQAYNETAPHKICQFIYEVSNNFNTFYHNVMILKCEDEELKASYISLLKLTVMVLNKAIDMLGFKAPEKM